MMQISEILDAFEWIETSFPRLLETKQFQVYENPKKGLDYDLVIQEEGDKYITVSIQDMMCIQLPISLDKIYQMYNFLLKAPKSSIEDLSHLINSKCTQKNRKYDYQMYTFGSYTFWLICRYHDSTNTIYARLQISLSLLRQPLNEVSTNQIFVMFRYYLKWTSLFPSRHIVQTVFEINKYFPNVIASEICLYL
jgi:hypothetical protein